jgi:uncharacterized membrane protein YdfJ with MMPL/SSD domain
MKPVWWMVSAGGVSWLVAALIVDQRTGIEVLFGMLGPLAATTGTWVLVERIYRQRAEALTAVMATAFMAKIVFFGGYIAVMILGLRFRPVPFVVSFTSYFIALYLMEALFLRRLFSERSR